MRAPLHPTLLGAIVVALVTASLSGLPAAATASTATPTTQTPTTTASPPTSATSAPAPSKNDVLPGVAEDPSLAVMNATGNHTMGSTVREFDPSLTTVQPSNSTKSLTTASVAASAMTVKPAVSLSSAVAGAPPGVSGLDVSGWQVLTAANWTTIYNNGARFVYTKATEGTTYVSSQFSEQYNDSHNAGLIHGAYHFATPNTSSGAAQANYFLAHGGAGTNDGSTLPPLLDIEYNPYGATCYGLSQAQMVAWIYDFAITIHNAIGRYPAFYSTTDWWSSCTGNSAGFGSDPLFIARYPNSISEGAGTLPASWSSYTMWQYADSGVFPGDQDIFNGSPTALQTYGLGTSLVRTAASASVYLVSGSNKYPVTNTTIYNALAPLGPIAYVAQSYLDNLTTQAPAGRIVRSPDGTIYFYDSGIKLPFSSCAMVVDYGGSCDPSGYIQLTTTQVSAFVTGPAMTSLMATTTGLLFYISAGSRKEILDTASETQAGISGKANILSLDATSYLPLTAPAISDSVFATVSGSTQYYFLAGGSKYPVDPAVASTAGLPGRSVGSLLAASLALVPTASTTFNGIIKASNSTSMQVLTANGSASWPAGLGGAKFSPLVVTPAFAATYPINYSFTSGSALMSTASSTVYLVMPTEILPVGSWETLLALSDGKVPTITVLPQAFLSSLPHGPVALTPGTLLRSPDNPMVYLINGVTNKVPFSNFIYPNEAGISGWSLTSDANLNAYPTSAVPLQFGITCGTTDYVSAGGSVHALSSSLIPLYPFKYTPLDSYTCALMPQGVTATEFIRTPDGAIYYLHSGQKDHVTSMARFAQLAGSQTWLNVAQEFGAAIPTGPTA